MALSATELRIGNYISHPNSDIDQIEEIFQKNGEYAVKPKNYHIGYFLTHENEELIKPIPLTEEWLLKFGFEKDKNILGSYTRKIKGEIKPRFRFHTQYTTKDKFLLATEIYYFEHIIFVQGDCKYVHQLQNLYFALTGEELTIKD